jgi:hypothetical protein
MRGGANSRHAVFGQKAAWRQDSDPGRDHQAAIRASQGCAKSFDDMPIRLTVRLEFCEVVIERRMDYGIGSGRSALQAFKIIQRAAMDLGSCPDNSSGSRIRASEAEHLVPRGKQFLDDGGADEPGRTCNKDTHEEILRGWMEAYIGWRIIVVK